MLLYAYKYIHAHTYIIIYVYERVNVKLRKSTAPNNVKHQITRILINSHS